MNDFGYLNHSQPVGGGKDKYVNILDEDLELLGEVPEPSNTIWKNQFMEPLIIFRNNIIVDAILFLLLFGILSAFVYVKSSATIVAKKYITDNDCTNY